MSGWATLKQILAGGSPGEMQEIYQFTGVGLAAMPGNPANGTTVAGQVFQQGALHVCPAILAGDGTTTEFSITHNLGLQPLIVRGYAYANGILGAACELDWTQVPGGSLTGVSVLFPVAPAAGVMFAAMVMG